MTKSQKEGLITAVLFLLLVYMVWSSFLAEDTREPAPGAERAEEAPAPEPGPEPALVPEAPRPVDGEIARLQEERMEMDWGSDPFLAPPEIEKDPGPEPEEDVEEEEAEPPIVLRGIASLNGRRQALIGIKTVTVGDTVRGYEVVSISEYAVTLRKEGEEHEIKIHD